MNQITSTFQEDAQHVIGPDGHRWYTYTVGYRDKLGLPLEFDLYAKSDGDVLERLDRIQQGNLEVSQLLGRTPVTPVSKIWVPILIWWKNLWS